MSLTNLKQYVDPAGVFCLNVEDENAVKQLLGRTGSGIGLITSDADENLLCSIAFDQTVKVSSFKLGHTDLEYAPKDIKVFINLPELDFDKAEDDLETPKGDAMAILTLNEKQAVGEESVQLRFVRFQAVNSIQVYVKSNYGGGDVVSVVVYSVLTPLTLLAPITDQDKSSRLLRTERSHDKDEQLR